MPWHLAECCPSCSTAGGTSTGPQTNPAHVTRSLWVAAGDSFSIADISAMPYMRMVMTKAGEADLVASFPNVQVPLAAAGHGLQMLCCYQIFNVP